MPPETWNQPAQPRRVPPVAHGAAVGGDGEHVEVFGVAGHHGDRRAGARRQRRPAERCGSRSPAGRRGRTARRASCILQSYSGRYGAAVIVVRALEQPDGARRHRARPAVDRGAVRIAHRRKRRRRRHRPAPLQGCAVRVDRDVRLARLARRVMVVAGLGAAGVVGVLVGEPVRRVPHLVDGDLGGAAGQRVGADRPAAAAVDGRVHHDDRDGELRDLRGGDRQHGGVVTDQQPADSVAAEGGVEVRAGVAPVPPRGDRIVGAGIGGADVDPEHVDRRAELVVRRRGAEGGDEVRRHC